MLLLTIEASTLYLHTHQVSQYAMNGKVCPLKPVNLDHLNKYSLHNLPSHTCILLDLYNPNQVTLVSTLYHVNTKQYPHEECLI